MVVSNGDNRLSSGDRVIKLYAQYFGARKTFKRFSICYFE